MFYAMKKYAREKQGTDEKGYDQPEIYCYPSLRVLRSKLNAFEHEDAVLVRIKRREVEKIKGKDFIRTPRERVLSMKEDHQIAWINRTTVEA